MTEQEIKEHRVRAAAQLEKIQMLFRRGKASQEAVDQAKAALESILNHQPVIEKITPKQAKQAEKERYEPERDEIRPEAASLIKEVSDEQKSIDIEKRKLSNQLATIAKGKSAKHIVDRILQLRDDWTEKGDEIKYAAQFGKRPETQSEQESIFNKDVFTASLPNDILRLDQMIRNERSNISKYKNKFSKAKTEVKRIYYEKLIVQSQLKINMLEISLSVKR